MKKIVMGLAALSMAASMFAVDISSKVQMDATLAGKAGDSVEFLKLNQKNQKDGDALIFSANTDKAGAQFQLWYTYDGTNGENSYKDETKAEAGTSAGAWEDAKLEGIAHGLRIRNVNVWFKPVDSLKITVGDTNFDSYKEHIFWWHGVYGAKPGSWGAFGGEYLAGNGVKCEYSPIDALSLTGVILPGVGNAWVTTGVSGVGAFGVSAKYNFGPATAAVLYAQNGDNKKIAVGSDFNIDAFYGMVNVTFNLGADGLDGIAIDNFEQYGFDGWNFQAHLPFVLYKSGDKMVPGMYVTLKVTTPALGAFTPYLLATTEPDGDAGWSFGKGADAFAFAMTFKPGVTFNVGSAAFDIAVRMDVAKGSFNWSIPCGIGVGL